MKKKEIIIATTNKGKVGDFKVLFPEEKYEIKTLLDFPDAIEVEETGTTFKENAALKAEYLCSKLNKIVIADDSGLSIDALNGAPGVYSARYSGIHGDTEGGIDKILSEMKDVPSEKRTAYYTCCIAVAFPYDETKFFEGHAYGKITNNRIGTNGFGFDSIFLCNETNKTWAELTIEEKNKVNHRSDAFNRLLAMNQFLKFL